MVEGVVRRVWREERKRESNIIIFELKIHFFVFFLFYSFF